MAPVTFELARWKDDAACIGKGAIFFPGVGESASPNSKAAYKICWEECPVRRVCLDYALRHNEDHGIWGGFSARGRRNLRKLART
jgi:WhiB family redox-sensing transcriptional regulator